MTWKLIFVAAEPHRITAELQAEDGSRKKVYLEAEALAMIGRASAPLWDGLAKTAALASLPLEVAGNPRPQRSLETPG